MGDGTRVGKADARVAAYGEVDEANSVLGWLVEVVPTDHAQFLRTIQHQLFDLGGELSIPDHALVKEEDVVRLERLLDELNAHLPPLKDFILPGGGEAAARCHVARTTVRRAERAVVALSRHQAVRPETVRYLNRLSDFLFVLARTLSRESGQPEVLWDHATRRG